MPLRDIKSYPPMSWRLIQMSTFVYNSLIAPIVPNTLRKTRIFQIMFCKQYAIIYYIWRYSIITPIKSRQIILQVRTFSNFFISPLHIVRISHRNLNSLTTFHYSYNNPITKSKQLLANSSDQTATSSKYMVNTVIAIKKFWFQYSNFWVISISLNWNLEA